MPHETPSPVDLPGPTLVGGRPLAWASMVIAIATLFLLLTNAVSLDDWANDLTPSPAQARLAEVTGWWRGVTDQIGLGAPRAALHDRWKAAEAARFRH